MAMQLGETGLCLQHDPARREEAEAFRARAKEAYHAGRREQQAALAGNGGVPRAPKTLQDAVRLASWITRATLIGKLDARTAEAATKALRQFQLGQEKVALQMEVESLRAQLSALKQPARSPRLA